MNILIIGLGSISRKHISALKEIGKQKGFIPQIYALRSSSSSDVVDGVFNLYSWDDVKAIKLKFVIISNPTSLHAQTIAECISLGVPMFIEKPVFSAVIPANYGIIETITALGIPTYVACNLRFLPCLQYVHRALKDPSKSEHINEVNIYCGSYLPSWRPDSDFRKSYSANKHLGGGVHLDLIHEIDYCTWLFGFPKGYRSTQRSNSSLKIDSIDYANYLLEYSRFCANITLNYYRRDYRRTLEIVFDDETWLVDLVADRITDSKGNIIFESEVTIADTYIRQMQFFIDNIQSSFPNFGNDIINAYDVLKIALRE